MTITSAQVVEQVVALAAERPEFVYRPVTDGKTSGLCSYVTGEHGQGCLVGQALMRLGIPEEALATFEREAGEKGLDTGAPNALPELGVICDHDDLDWLADVQLHQDAGHPWGQAVEEAGA